MAEGDVSILVEHAGDGAFRLVFFEESETGYKSVFDIVEQDRENMASMLGGYAKAYRMENGAEVAAMWDFDKGRARKWESLVMKAVSQFAPPQQNERK